MGQLAQRVRAKFPGAYDDMDDAALEKAVLAKHPEYADLATKPEPPKQEAAQPAVPKGYLESGGMFGEGNILNGVLKLAKAAYNHPVTAGAMIGGAVAAPLTGGTSLLPAMAASGLGAAGGAGLGSIASAARGDDDAPKTAGDVAKNMAIEGAGGAIGEGIGQGAAKALRIGGKLVYGKAALRPSIPLQREFGDVAETGLREGVSVGQAGAKKAADLLTESADKTAAMLAAKDAERPVVRGLLPAGRGADLGAAPIHPTMPGLRDPRSAGVLLREGAAAAEPWAGGAPAQMIDPREIASRGLGAARGELADRALAGDALGQLGDLEQRFIAQRGGKPLTLVEAQRLKQAEQKLADSAYHAEQMGNPVNGIDAGFHQGIARGTREAIEQRVPEVAGQNARTQALIGLNRAMTDATRRNVPGVGNIRTLLGDFIPGVSSRAAIAADRFGRTSVPTMTLKEALIAALGGGQ